MELKGRLRAIADMVDPCDTVCDVGTDHAYVPIYLVQKGICKRAIATDLRKGPLDKAEQNIERYDLKSSIQTRLGDGLNAIKPGEADTIVAAGMGGQLITQILSDCFETASRTGNLILQPMNAPEALRKWLYENGFSICDESLVKDGRKIYCIIAAKWTGKKYEKPALEYYINEALVKKKDALIKEYLDNWIKKLTKEINGLVLSSSHNNDFIYKTELKNKMEQLRKSL